MRRTFLLFLSVKEGMKHSELTPGDTLADAILQRDFLQSATAAAMSRARAGCRGTQVRNTRVTSATGASQPDAWSSRVVATTYRSASGKRDSLAQRQTAQNRRQARNGLRGD